MEKDAIISLFSDIMFDSTENYSICNFVTEKFGSEYLFKLLKTIERKPISKVQLDQLLSLHRQKNITDDFYSYYWMTSPANHFYKIDLPADIDLEERIDGKNCITTVRQLKWGFERIFIDCLYLYGNIQAGYDILSQMSSNELQATFDKVKFDTEQIMKRGKALPFEKIDKEDRYLISEMACKTLATTQSQENFINFIVQSYKAAVEQGVTRVKFQDLLEGKFNPIKGELLQLSIFSESASEEDMIVVESEDDVRKKGENLAKRFWKAHESATSNTSLYLSLCNDLDVYVATSMRNKKDFLEMANFCESVFKNSKIKDMHLRYFDPTISAADTHEDKGLIECLMVRSARILIYSAGLKDSYGKDAEAAMALSMGKPTIFYCKETNGKAKFYKDVHPLSRLVNFRTGVAGGVMVCEKVSEVIDIIYRLVSNKMQYKLEQKGENSGFYLLKESLTDSVVRVQTNNKLLASAFWNNYIKP